MTTLRPMMIALSAGLLVTPAAFAQGAGASARSFVRAGTTFASDASADADTPDAGTYSKSALVMITNRAHTLGDRLSASGTRYFAVTDADLAGASPQEALARLSPTAITAADHVRHLQIVVDVTRPVTVDGSAAGSTSIGTAIISGPGVRYLNVTSYIFANGLTVRDK